MRTINGTFRTTDHVLSGEGKDISAKVCIVGAGASGLMCAKELMKEGSYHPEEILILEGRDRVGGRIHSSEYVMRKMGGEERTIIIDHGAAWIHGTGYDWPASREDAELQLEKGPINNQRNPMMDLFQQSTPQGQSIYETHFKPTFVVGNPWLRPNHAVREKGELVLFVDGTCLRKDSPMMQDGLDKHFWIFRGVAVLADEMYESGRGNDTVYQSLQESIDIIKRRKKDWLLPSDDSETLKAVVGFFQHMVECWCASSASQLQLIEFAKDIDDQEKDWDAVYRHEGDFYGPHCTMKNGMIKVLEPLLTEDVSSRIILNAEVTKVMRLSDQVRVETASGLSVTSDYCVITMPLGVLSDAIDRKDTEESFFEPQLSNDKADAIKKLDEGAYKKVFLVFDRIFWPKSEAFLGLIRQSKGNDGLGNYLLCDNLWAKDGLPCIEAIVFGPAGKWAAFKTDEVIRDAIFKFFEEAMALESSISEWCVDCHVTRWEEDRFSRGAYSAWKLGTTEKQTEDLSKPEWDGHLLFAGEATNSEYEGSVHGALSTGERAALELRHP